MYWNINLSSTGYQCLMAAELAHYAALTGLPISVIADERQVVLFRDSYPSLAFYTEDETSNLGDQRIISGWQISELLAQADSALPWFLTGFVTGDRWMLVGLPLSIETLPRLRWNESVASASKMAVHELIAYYEPAIRSDDFKRIQLVGILYDKKSSAPESGVSKADREAWSAARSLPLALLAEKVGELQRWGRDTGVLYIPVSLQYSRSPEDERATRQIEAQVSQVFMDPQIPLYRSAYTTWWGNFEAQAAFLSSLAQPNIASLPSSFCYLGAGATPCHLIQLLPKDVQVHLSLLFPDQDAPTGAIDGNGYWQQFAHQNPRLATAYVGDWLTVTDQAIRNIMER